LKRDLLNRQANRTISVNGISNTAPHSISHRLVGVLANALAKLGLLRGDADYHLMRTAMVITFFFFGYQK